MIQRKMIVSSMATAIAMTTLLVSGCGASTPSTSNAGSGATSSGTAANPSNGANATNAANGSSGGTGGSQPAGTLTVYGALTTANGKAIADAFESFDPNAKVNMITAGTGKLITRINAEEQAGGVKADVLLLADPTVMPPLRQQNVLASYLPPQAASLPGSLKGSDWVGAFTFHNVILYHKGMSLPIPKSFKDLTNAAYKGQVELGDPAYSGTTLGMVGYLSKQYGYEYFKSLKQNGATVVSSTNTVGTDVASGREDIGITLDSVANSLVKKGSPVVEVWPSDASVPVPAPVSIVKGKDNALTEAFVNWLLSSGGQKVVASVGLAPELGTSDLVPQNAPMANVDWSSIGSQRQNILGQFKAIFN
ncbi:extracellular solute-binding protein [Alicyclobacillus curvatus]|nr:extracellular solute-binding protein [Alicyclobacillus curvatus]